MAAQPDAIFVEGLDFFTSAVDRLDAPGWQLSSPCEGWVALDALGHVGAAVQFGTMLLTGGQPVWSPADPPGAVVEGEPRAWWAAIAEPARLAVAGVDLAQMVDSPMGRRTVGDGLSFPALDLFIHAWDLGKSVGAELVVPARVIDFTHHVIDPLPDAAVRNRGVFASAVLAPSDASESQEFIAWTGRDSLWSPSSNH
ncbi:MAG: maleylpyruvate isomerase N-terminal domain-containing protein [Actinomycetota bacterium]|nr:maleylpyruvate isomerase N-terminal domain-containing protein [Actinomycetota bacterium]